VATVISITLLYLYHIPCYLLTTDHFSLGQAYGER
jgi:hypothetical protein